MKRNQIEIIDLAPIGLAIAINGQRFDLVAHEDFTSRAGNSSVLMVWRSECASCGAGFTCMSRADFLPEARRCVEHRQPGKPVRP